MGSSSDLAVLKAAGDALARFGIGYEVRVLSAHRRPADCAEYARTAHERGLRVLIAGAGLAAHLPGVLAAHTPLPVIGVPIASTSTGIGGMDALLSIVQMPRGVPVASVGIGNAENAGLLAVQILATADPALQAAYIRHKEQLAEAGIAQDEDIQKQLGA
jgi:5-(carboxyamino)imidazole ribonucleotide mutase